jgi:hypothetical protein
MKEIKDKSTLEKITGGFVTPRHLRNSTSDRVTNRSNRSRREGGGRAIEN